jgi:uncharacterized protein YqjF (DUF2071 family)
MAQTWIDLLFMHWPVPVEVLRSLIPEPLEIDAFDGVGWIGVVPFGMVDVHFKHLPPIPFMSNFLELNVRSYVKWREKSGLYFFSLDATNPLAVEAARLWYCLPYYHAQMSKSQQNNAIHYACERSDSRGRKGELEVVYRPTGNPYVAKKKSLESWLTERYCFFTLDKYNQVVTGEVHHKPWPLQQANAEIRTNTMAKAAGISLPDEKPLLHFVRKLETIEWAIHAEDNSE